MEAMQAARLFLIILAMIVCYPIIIMIRQILRKEYDTQKRREKIAGKPRKSGKLYFKGEDGNYYVCDSPGMKGVEEMYKLNRQFKRNIESQITLI